MSSPNTFRAGPDERGLFGMFGGRYVAETLMPLVLEVERAYDAARRDPEFAKEYRKLTADDPTPLLPENHEKAIREIPRDPEIIELFKVLVGPKKLPPRG